MSSRSREQGDGRWQSVVDTHRKMIAEALEAATIGSVISSVDQVTLTADNGDELRITTAAGERSGKSGGGTETKRSGTFVVGGEKLTIDEGRVVTGPESPGGLRAWALFALMPADRGQLQARSNA